MIALKKEDLTVIILTYNEELHLKRAIESVIEIATCVWVVDSYSNDNTLAIANAMGAQVVQHGFTNQADQFLWALEHCDISTKWIMRLDADEYLTEALREEIQKKLNAIDEEITGIVLKRRVYFMGKWIRHGGYYPVELLRIWRAGVATIEKRWMDEQVVLLRGRTITFHHDFVDENLSSLTSWTSKHNDYATREAIETLKTKYNLNTVNGEVILNSSSKKKRWYKNNLYNKMPLFLRSLLYFLYRYIFKMGILDGKKGLIWHFLQGFWYRFLVDAKIYQIKYFALKEKKSIQSIIEEKNIMKNI